MKPYCELKAEMEVIQQQLVEVKKKERANGLKKVNWLHKEYGFPKFKLLIKNRIANIIFVQKRRLLWPTLKAPSQSWTKFALGNQKNALIRMIKKNGLTKPTL